MLLFKNKIINLLLMGLLMTSCGQQEVVYQQDFYVFGTLVNISIWGVSQNTAQQAMKTVADDFQTMHHQWHAWQPGPLVDLNRAFAAGETVTVAAETRLIPMIEQTQRFYKQTEGLFNPAIGYLIALWGFHGDDLPTGVIPSPAAIAELLALKPTMDDIEIHGNQVSSRNRAVQLDFGGFAKGYAVDLAIERLRQLGVTNAIVNAGGNLKAIGHKGDQPWRIGIRHPSGSGVLASITIAGEESVITSGNYERYHEYQGVRYSHIIDPRNGQSAQGIASVTVINPSGALADTASTALAIAGVSDWQRIAHQLGIKYVMLVDDQGAVYMNPAMADRVQFLVTPPKTVIQ